MKKNLLLLITFALTCSLWGQSSLQFNQYVVRMNDGDFNKASLLFHIPEEFTPQRRQSDRELLSRILAFVQEKMGPIENLTPSEVHEDAFGITIFGGTPNYWQQRTLGTPTSFAVNFGIDGPGYLTFYSHRDEAGKLKIRQVNYALSENHPDSKKRFTELSGELLLVIRDWELEKDAQPGDMRFSAIVVEEAALAESIYQQLQDGGDFVALAKAHSMGPGKTIGGDMGYIAPTDLSGILQTVAYQLNVGEYSQPISTANGVFILRKTGEKR